MKPISTQNVKSIHQEQKELMQVICESFDIDKDRYKKHLPKGVVGPKN